MNLIESDWIIKDTCLVVFLKHAYFVRTIRFVVNVQCVIGINVTKAAE